MTGCLVPWAAVFYGRAYKVGVGCVLFASSIFRCIGKVGGIGKSVRLYSSDRRGVTLARQGSQEGVPGGEEVGYRVIRGILASPGCVPFLVFAVAFQLLTSGTTT